jgi:predicted kinase
MNKLNKPIIFIFSGLPASGKSTLSQFVAKEHKATYLRIDTIEQGFRDLCNVNVEGEGYSLAYRVATDNLKIGLNVVADSCNPINLTRKEWEQVAKSNNCYFINIEIICSNKTEHKQRAESRNSEVENLKLPKWNDIENREYHEWETERIIVDTANKTIEESEMELRDKIEKIIIEKKSCT